MSVEDSSFKGEESGLSADLTWPGVGDRLFLLERASGVSEWEARSPLISSGSIWSPYLHSSFQEQHRDAEQAGQEEKDGRRDLDGRFTTAELPSFFQTEGPMIDEPLEPEEELKEEQAEEEQVDLSRRGRGTISTEDIKSFQARLAAFAEAIRSREGPEGVRESKMTARSAQREEEEEEEEGKTKNDRSFTPFSCWGQDKDEKEQFAGHDEEEENAGGEDRAPAGDQEVDDDTDLQEDGAGAGESARRLEEEGAEEGSRHVRSLSRELRVKLLMRSLITTAQLEDKGVVRGNRIRTQTKEARLRTTEDKRRNEGRSEGAAIRASLDARKGGGGEEENRISCAQRVVWLLLGSGLTSLMALLYFWLFADTISSVRVL